MRSGDILFSHAADRPPRPDGRATITAMRASIVGGLLLCCLVFASGAGAEVLVEQRPGPAATGVPSRGPGGKPIGTPLAADDIVVPPGEHWSLSAIHPFGTRADASYDVTIYDASSIFHADTGITTGIPGNPDFEESEVAPAPDGTIPISGAPLLREGGYWIAVSSRSAATEPWGWLTSDAGAGYPANWVDPSEEILGCGRYFWAERRNCLPATAAEPDQAFVLEGTQMQTLTATSYGEQGAIVSSPPGIACPPTCDAVFPRGTVVSLTGSPVRPNMEFIYWHVGGFPSASYSGIPGAAGGPPSLAEITDPENAGPVPCAPGPDGATAALINPCLLTLSADVYINAIFRTSSFDIGKPKLQRNLRDGTAQLALRLPAPGKLSLVGAAVRPWQAPGSVHGTVRVPIVARGNAAARLRRSGRTKVALLLTYTSFDRKPESATRHVTLLRRLPR